MYNKGINNLNNLKLVILLGLFVLSGSLLAQNFELELSLRPALTSLRGNDMVEKHLDAAIYPSLGLGLNRLFANKSLVSIGVLYDMKGGQNTEEYNFRDDRNQPLFTQEVKTKSNFQYITIPIEWGKRFGNRIQYHLGLGVYSAFLLSQELITEYDGDAGSIDLTDSYKKVDVGLSANFCIYVPLKESWSLKAGVNDYLGLFDTMKSDVEHDGSTKHNSLGLVVGLNYRLHKTN